MRSQPLRRGGRGGRRLGLKFEVRDALLQRVNRLGLALGRGLDERPDLVGEEVGVAAAHDRTWRRFLLAEQLAEEAASVLRFHVRRRRGELRNGVRLDVMRAGERAQVSDQLLFVARRQERGEQDDVGNPGRQLGDGRVARVDEDQLRADQFPDNALEDSGLAVVRLDREHERQGLGPYHEEKEHRPDRREHHDRAVLETLSLEC